MRLDFLPEGCRDGPLVGLFDYTPAEAGDFQAALLSLARGAADRVAVHDLSYVEAVGGFRLTLRLTPWDQAMVRISAEEYRCGFTRETWENIAGLFEPFVKGSSGFQWLAGSPGEASLLLSADGRW